MTERCTQIQKDGFHICGSYAFNLWSVGIDQGDLCDVCYWRKRAEDVEENTKAAYQRGYLDGMAKPCVKCADRKWVGLTDEERDELWFRLGYIDLMIAIEAKLKEKNT